MLDGHRVGRMKKRRAQVRLAAGRRSVLGAARKDGKGLMLRKAGIYLRKLREDADLTLKEVERLSYKCARKNSDKRYILSSARLSQMENEGSIPGIYKLHTLSQIYGVSVAYLLRFYGIESGSDQEETRAR